MKNTQQTLSILFFLLVSLSLSNDLISQRLQINMDNSVVRQGETVCIDLVVENFTDLIVVGFALSWDPAILEYVETTNLPIPLSGGASFNEGDVGSGKLPFSWLDVGSGVTLPDGQILFTICLKAIGEQGANTKIRIGKGDSDLGIEVIRNDGKDIGLSSFDPEVDISFDDPPDNAVFLYTDDIDIPESGSFCIPVRVRNFVKLDIIQFSMNWTTTRFKFDQITSREEQGGDWNVFANKVNDDIIYTGFDNSFAAEGISLDDGTLLFEVCLTHILDETCVFEELMISPNPTPITASKIEDDDVVTVPVIYEPGKIRLRKPLAYNDETITHVTCNEPNIGFISVDVTEGTDSIKYLWSNGDTTNAISNLTAGRYDVSISDVCLAVDTIFKSFEVMLDGVMPTANAGDDIEFECGEETVFLDGTGSSTTGVAYSWRSLDGHSIIAGAGTVQAEVDQIGQYELLVMDNATGCTATDTVEVIDLRTIPEVMAGDDVMLQCDDVTIQLTGTGSTGENFQYEWTTEDGNIVDEFSKEGINVDRPGTYTLKITDIPSGCSATDDLIISGDNVTPELGIVGSSSITCTESELTLGASNSEASGISYTWSTTDGTIVSGADEFEVVISAPGRYEVVAENVSGCTSSDAKIIIDQRTMPLADAGDDTMIGCDDDNITLNGSGSIGPEYEYTWVTTDGSIVSQTTDGQAIVNSAGTYTFTVREIDNDCSTSEDVVVTGDNERPQASISGSTSLDCNVTSLQLNANNGGGAVAGLSYSWSTTDGSISDGADGVLATIDEPGTYTVRVTNDVSGCSDNSTITVTSETQVPSITTSGDATVDCTTEIKTLTVISDNMTNVDFQWNIIEGNGQIVTGATSSIAEVMGLGKYEIVVTNPLNGCSSRDTTIVALSNRLTPAEVDMDYDHCDPETILMGNQPEDVTGLWTVIDGNAVLEDPMDGNCSVNSLSEGINTFVWTLSSVGCPDYSSDTININFIADPVAIDDNYEVTQGFGSLEIDLLSNDQFSSQTGVMVNLISEPSQGILTDNGNGQFTYTLDDPDAFGNFTFEYEICDELCSLGCDIGMVTINVRDGSLPPVNPDGRSNDPQSLGITPNGDGLNDQLVFDELLTNSDKYSTKRLIVYNRWGDIVHEAQPYNNDWGGTNKKGGLLPQGTYYFVMQLDLGQGSIIEGDVTILQ